MQRISELIFTHTLWIFIAVWQLRANMAIPRSTPGWGLRTRRLGPLDRPRPTSIWGWMVTRGANHLTLSPYARAIEVNRRIFQSGTTDSVGWHWRSSAVTLVGSHVTIHGIETVRHSSVERQLYGVAKQAKMYNIYYKSLLLFILDTKWTPSKSKSIFC